MTMMDEYKRPLVKPHTLAHISKTEECTMHVIILRKLIENIYNFICARVDLI